MDDFSRKKHQEERGERERARERESDRERYIL
jgi:hypothetical protein